LGEEPKKVRSVKLVPEGKDLTFITDGRYTTVIVSEVAAHAMVSFDF